MVDKDCSTLFKDSVLFSLLALSSPPSEASPSEAVSPEEDSFSSEYDEWEE
jgi:hypothetical protein